MKLVAKTFCLLFASASTAQAGKLRVDLNPPEPRTDILTPHWEKAHGLNPNDPSDANKDLNGDGYSNVEKYLNSRVGGYSL